MQLRQETLTVTLHWSTPVGEQTTTVLCEDSPPAQLLPLLLQGCGLPVVGADGHGYSLRLGSANGRRLPAGEPLSAAGVRSGSHLWLSDLPAAIRQRWLLRLPAGCECVVPEGGVELTRAWLLQVLALFAPPAYSHELNLLTRRISAYAAVSKRPHCTLRPGPDGLSVSTTRSDVTTLLNGTRLVPAVPVSLSNGDRLTLGDEGPTLLLSRVEGEIVAGASKNAHPTHPTWSD